MRTWGLTAATYERLILDAGVVYKNFIDLDNPGVPLGATRGGSVFTVETEIIDLKVDGAIGAVVGGQHIIKAIATLEANFIESTTEIFKRALPGALVEDAAPHDIIYREGVIDISDYLDNVVILAQVSGTEAPIVLMVKNALSDGKLSLALTEGNEAGSKIKFIGHYDPDDLAMEPWRLIVPMNLGEEIYLPEGEIYFPEGEVVLS